MKIRTGFVSNSSSSSFLVHRKDITFEQYLMICYACEEKSVDWRLFLTYGSLTGYTSLDNFEMSDFFEKIGVKKKVVKWSRRNASEPFKDGKSPIMFSKEYEKIEKIARKKVDKLLKEWK